jgi:hypothetical protein
VTPQERFYYPLAKIDNWVDKQLGRAQQEKELLQETLTSGFERGILRLTSKDVQFLKDCGIAAE